MSNIAYHLPPLLSPEQADAILGDGIRILAEIGIECRHDGVNALCAKAPGFRVCGGRILFETALCREHIEKIRARLRDCADPSREHTQKSTRPQPLAESGPIRLKGVGPWTCLNVIDLESGAVRPGRLQDVIDATKLQVALGVEGRKICAPVAPGDVPSHLQCLAMAREAWTYSADTGGGIVSSLDELRFMWELGQLAHIEPPYGFAEFGISPLTFNARALDLVFRARGSELMGALAIDPGPIPTLGGTGPMAMRAVLAQSVAETLGGSLLTDLLTGGAQTPGCTAMTAVGTDLRFGTVNFSSPESILLLQLGFELGSHLTGRFSIGGALRSIGKQPDAQAAAEKMMCALVGALSGARHFCDLGQLSVDDLFCYEQFVIDVELIACAERFVNGFPFEEVDVVAMVREGLEDRHFLMHPATLENLHAYYWYPTLFDRRMLAPWQADGAPTVVQKAREVAAAKITGQGPRVDDATRRKMDDLFDAAARTL